MPVLDAVLDLLRSVPVSCRSQFPRPKDFLQLDEHNRPILRLCIHEIGKLQSCWLTSPQISLQYMCHPYAGASKRENSGTCVETYGNYWSAAHKQPLFSHVFCVKDAVSAFVIAVFSGRLYFCLDPWHQVCTLRRVVS